VVLGVVWLVENLGRRFRNVTRQAPGIPPPDRIHEQAAVADRARRTERLLEALAQRDSRFDPAFIRPLVRSTFCQVQQCWQERDYGPVAHLLMPGLLAEHQSLLHAMRANGEVNRIEDLQVRRLEFVHLSCPEQADGQEVTALITFEAKVYFVNEMTGAYLRGDRQGRAYQEFWVFRRQGDVWRLQAIERSHESNRLAAENRIAGMTAGELCNHQEGASSCKDHRERRPEGIAQPPHPGRITSEETP
jgi:predicted lipid-binding transport protein (Tim44 family)